jgi:hypothetical protein
MDIMVVELGKGLASTIMAEVLANMPRNPFIMFEDIDRSDGLKGDAALLNVLDGLSLNDIIFMANHISKLSAADSVRQH